MRRIHEFDGVRALAVSLVIADHYAPFRNFAHSAPARYGGAGVDVFFVLSGFLITDILLRAREEEHAYRVFYARRFLRIAPAYLLLLLLVYGAGAILREPINKANLAGQLLFLRSFKGSEAVLAHCAQSLRYPFSLPSLFRRVPFTLPPREYGHYPMAASLGPTWSLSVEEWFYLLWAPVVLHLSRRGIFLASLLVCGCAFVLRWSGGGTSFFTTADVLIAGAVLALWFERRTRLCARTSTLVDRAIDRAAIFAAFLWLLLSWLHRDMLSLTLLEIASFGAIAWIVRNSGGRSLILRLLRWKPLAYIGSISYMIYLIHLPLYFLIRRAVEAHSDAILSETARTWVVALLSVAATMIFSALSWEWYERPLLKQKERMTAFLQRVPAVRETLVEPAMAHEIPTEQTSG